MPMKITPTKGKKKKQNKLTTRTDEENAEESCE